MRQEKTPSSPTFPKDLSDICTRQQNPAWLRRESFENDAPLTRDMSDLQLVDRHWRLYVHSLYDWAMAGRIEIPASANLHYIQVSNLGVTNLPSNAHVQLFQMFMGVVPISLSFFALTAGDSSFATDYVKWQTCYAALHELPSTPEAS